ncbi:tetratricopeptide repeat protein [Herbidospora sp. NEAU-GS84]|uniref:Tetratricopeptide repeat protein n=1 Tax=Herbidospora solisilvae TaxID=2696284 RepID=A0A7C9NBJ1_9ACTN|nr:FxSxx-COOH system tetratricopeptide repeat protein [Herbidospora solisilvae]NAS26633.1 tetratricopeptide repeat protein [Herbidospora solisilvae]
MIEFLLGWLAEEALAKGSQRLFAEPDVQAVLKKARAKFEASLPAPVPEAVGMLLTDSAWFAAPESSAVVFKDLFVARFEPLAEAVIQRGPLSGRTAAAVLADHDLTVDDVARIVAEAVESSVREVAAERGGLPELLRQADTRLLLDKVTAPSGLPRAASVTAATGLNNLPRPPATIFVGRGEALRDLDDALTGDANVVITQSVYGLGGVGKSELALHHAHASRARYVLRWWITAADPRRLDAGLAALTRRLTGQEPESTERAVEWAITWLQVHRGWLLILDNVENADDIQPLLGQLNHGHVLITSRRDIGWHRLAIPIKLDVLAPESGTDLLTGLTGRTSAEMRAVAEAIATELGNLPLALEQASAYIHQTGVTFDRYLAKLKAQPAKMHAATGDGSTAYTTIDRLWRITLETIAKRNPTAVGLLHLLAHYAPDDIPREILPTEWNEDETDELLGLLASYSMITLTDDAISMHRLVQAVLRATESAESRGMREPALDLVSAALPENPQQNVAGWSFWRRLTPHVLALAAAEDGSETLGAILNQAVIFELTQGNAAAAHSLACSSLRICEAALGPDHADVASRLANLASTLWSLGRAADALALQQRALTITETTLGADHPDVGDQLANLAITLRALGRTVDALPFNERALTITETAFGPSHPHVAARLANLATTLWTLGRAEEALGLNERALDIAETTYGPDHPNVAEYLSTLAACLRTMGRAADALPLNERALTVTETAFGPEHPEVAARLDGLAASLCTVGRAADALPHQQRALTIAETTLDPHHPNITHQLTNLASVLCALGRVADALPLNERALAIAETTLGPDHPNLAARLAGLAASLYELGRAADALPHQQRALTITETTLGPDHPKVAHRLANLGAILRELGRAADALPHQQRALTITETILGPKHPDVAHHLTNVAVTKRRMGMPDEALPLLNRALDIAAATYGTRHQHYQDAQIERSRTLNAACPCGSGRKFRRCHRK